MTKPLARRDAQEVTLVIAPEPGVSAQQSLFLRTSWMALGAQAATRDLEAPPPVLAALDEVARSAAAEVGAAAWGAPETARLDALLEAEGDEAAAEVRAAGDLAEAARGAAEAAERALEAAPPVPSRAGDAAVEHALAVVLGALTGVALGASAEAAGLAPDSRVAAVAAVPWAIGVAWGVASGLGLLRFGTRASGRELAAAAALTALPMALLAVGRTLRAEGDPDELFAGVVVGAVELAGVIGLAKLADARRRGHAAWAEATERRAPLVLARDGARERHQRALRALAAARRRLQAFVEAVRTRTAAHLAGEKLAAASRAWARFGLEVRLRETAAGLEGFDEHAVPLAPLASDRAPARVLPFGGAR